MENRSLPVPTFDEFKEQAPDVREWAALQDRKDADKYLTYMGVGMGVLLLGSFAYYFMSKR